MAQSVMCLTCKQENLSLMFRTHVKMPGVGARAYNPSAGEAETNGS